MQLILLILLIILEIFIIYNCIQKNKHIRQLRELNIKYKEQFKYIIDDKTFSNQNNKNILFSRNFVNKNRYDKMDLNKAHKRNKIQNNNKNIDLKEKVNKTFNLMVINSLDLPSPPPHSFIINDIFDRKENSPKIKRILMNF